MWNVFKPHRASSQRGKGCIGTFFPGEFCCFSIHEGKGLANAKTHLRVLFLQDASQQITMSVCFLAEVSASNSLLRCILRLMTFRRGHSLAVFRPRSRRVTSSSRATSGAFRVSGSRLTTRTSCPSARAIERSSSGRSMRQRTGSPRREGSGKRAKERPQPKRRCVLVVSAKSSRRKKIGCQGQC